MKNGYSRKKLKGKRYKNIKDYEERILNFNPKIIYSLVNVNFKKRKQSIKMAKMFPKPKEKICSCGCRKKLKGRQTRWATKSCQWFAYHVNCIINGDSKIIKRYLEIYFNGWKCCKCPADNIFIEYKNGLSVSAIQVDHILAVINGGGGCWLSNYQLLCINCHKLKTKKDLFQ